VQDKAHDAESADHQNNSMLDYLKKCKNNHSTSSLPQKIRCNAYNVKHIWKQRVATLDPLDWHALDLPWVTTCSNTHLHPITRRMQETPLNSFQEWKSNYCDNNFTSSVHGTRVYIQRTQRQNKNALGQITVKALWNH